MSQPAAAPPAERSGTPLLAVALLAMIVLLVLMPDLALWLPHTLDQ